MLSAMAPIGFFNTLCCVTVSSRLLQSRFMAEPTPGELRLLELAARNQLAQEAGGADSPGRRRIDLLLDAETFFETRGFMVSPAPNPALGGRRIPGDGVVTGSGLVGGRPVFVFAQEPGVFGGSLGEAGAAKIAALIRSAMSAGAPLVGLYDSCGLRLEDGVAALAGAGEVAFEQARAAGVVPQLAAIFGSCAQGAADDAAALLPALADFIFATSTVPGMHPNVAEAEVLSAMRRLLALLPSSRSEGSPHREASPQSTPGELSDAIEQHAGDILAAIACVVDRDSLLELQPQVAANIITAFARMGGRPVGIVANQPSVLGGALDGDACAKAARFVRFLHSFGFPLIVFVDTPGTVPGTDPEALAGLLRAFARMTAPRLTVTVGRSSGQACAIMNPRPPGAGLGRLHLAWPSAEIAAASPEAAIERLHGREFEGAARTAAAIWPQGKPFSEDDRERIVSGLREERLDDYRKHFANPWAAAERGLLDAVIRPSETRRRLLHALDVLHPGDVALD